MTYNTEMTYQERAASYAQMCEVYEEATTEEIETNQQQESVPVTIPLVVNAVAFVGANETVNLVSPIIYTNAFGTKDGLYLRYDYAKSKSKQTYQAKTDTFLKALKKASKEQLPRLDLLAGTLQGVFADFDDIEKIKRLVPVGFSGSWYDVRRWLACKFTNGCVFPSASGKAKVFFPFTEAGLTSAKAKNRLKTLLGTEYFNATDNKGTSVRFSFINTEAYGVLAIWLKSVDYTDSLLTNDTNLNKNREGRVILSTEKEEYKWNVYKGNLPENMVSDLLAKSKEQKHTLYCEEVIRYALGTNTSISTGVAIPQTLAAKTLGISQRAVSETIAFLKNNGVLKKVANEKAHYKAAKYAFCGFWVSVAANIFKSDSRAISGALKTVLETIEDGNWNDPLFLLTNYFSTEEAYMDFVRTIPGNEEKTRLTQAKNAWASHVRLDANKTINSKTDLKYA